MLPLTRRLRSHPGQVRPSHRRGEKPWRPTSCPGRTGTTTTVRPPESTVTVAVNSESRSSWCHRAGRSERPRTALRPGALRPDGVGGATPRGTCSRAASAVSQLDSADWKLQERPSEMAGDPCVAELNKVSERVDQVRLGQRRGAYRTRGVRVKGGRRDLHAVPRPRRCRSARRRTGPSRNRCTPRSLESGGRARLSEKRDRRLQNLVRPFPTRPPGDLTARTSSESADRAPGCGRTHPAPRPGPSSGSRLSIDVQHAPTWRRAPRLDSPHARPRRSREVRTARSRSLQIELPRCRHGSQSSMS